MLKLPRNVIVLTIAQSLMMTVSTVVVFVGGLVGTQLAPNEKLATLPTASIVIGTALTIVPVTLLMKKLGRKQVFLLNSIFSILVTLLVSYAIYIGAFYLFCASVFLFGITVSTVMQFRFAAIESVAVEQIPKAASTVLLGGIAAAFIGPEIAVFGKTLFEIEFVGSFLLLAALFLLAFFILLLFNNPESHQDISNIPQRTLKEISKQSVFWIAILSAAIGYAVMSFIMTATPVSMHIMDGHTLQDTKWVIQSHILAMFVPSIFTAYIIKRLGIVKMLMTGLIAYLICIAIAFAGHELVNYWVSLILLGIGWNFLFIGGTTLLPQSYRPEERFKVQALNEFIVFGVQAVAALSAGWFVFALGWEQMLLYTIPIVVFLMTVIGRWAVNKK